MKFPRPRPISRRAFFALASAVVAAPWMRASGSGEMPGDLRGLIDAYRPSRNPRPEFYRDWLGTTLADGRYYFTDQPNLIEGAGRMLALGTRVGKFWFEPLRAARDYPWNSRWPAMRTLSDLAASEYWTRVFAMPFSTLMLEAHSPLEADWMQPQGDDYYANLTAEWEALVRHLYSNHGDRALTIILQNWEGDWQLRGGAGRDWATPPADWPLRCERMVRRLAARQRGVSLGRAAAKPGARLRVVHAAEVNRVTDHWRGIPTMTGHVLPHVEVDLVSYSSYDGMADGPTLYRCIETIRRHTRTTGPFGPGAVYVGEMGIPENVQPAHIAERWDELLGAALAARVLHVAQWELYCNEFDPRAGPAPAPPIRDGRYLRGFWLIRPDGSLSETGRVFRRLWGA